MTRLHIGFLLRVAPPYRSSNRVARPLMHLRPRPVWIFDPPERAALRAVRRVLTPADSSLALKAQYRAGTSVLLCPPASEQSRYLTALNCGVKSGDRQCLTDPRSS